jgi:chromosome segregation ATPase
MSNESVGTTRTKALGRQSGKAPNPLYEMERLARPILDILPTLRTIIGGGEAGNDFHAIERGMQQAIQISRRVEALQAPLTELDSEVQRLKDEIHRLDLDLNRKKSSQEILAQQLASLQINTKSCTTERELIQGDVERKKEELQVYENEMEKLRREDGAIQSRLLELKDKIPLVQDAEQKVEARETAALDTEKRLEQDSADIARRKKEVEQQEHEVERRQEEAIDQSQRNGDQLAQIEQRETAIHDFRDANNRAREMLDQEKEILKQDQGRLQQVSLELSGKRAELKSEELRNHDDLAHLSGIVLSLRSAVGIVEISTAPEAFEGLSNYATALSELLATEIGNLRREVKAKENENREARKSINQIFNSGKLERDQFKKEIEDLKQERLEDSERMKMMTSKNTELQLSLDDCTRQGNLLRGHCHRLETSQKTSIEEHYGTKRKLTESEIENKHFKSSVSEAEKTNTTLKHRVGDLESRLQVAENWEGILERSREENNGERAARIRLQSQVEQLRRQVSQQQRAATAVDSAALSEAQRVLEEESAVRDRLDALINEQIELNAQCSQSLAKVKEKENYLNDHWERNKESIKRATDILAGISHGCWCGSGGEDAIGRGPVGDLEEERGGVDLDEN